MKPEIEVSAGPQEVARHFADLMKEIIDSQQTVHIGLSGGSTPKLLFDQLAEAYSGKAPWSNVQLYWVDERCVPPDNAESNYKMTYDHLLSKIDIPEENIHRIKGENDPEKEAARYSEEIKSLVPEKGDFPRFDMLLMGMGTDGHTASIFPNQMELISSDKICEVATHPESGQKRVSLTGKVINNASKVAFLVTGESKAEKVVEILYRQGAWRDYPATYVQPGFGELVWFLDESAAKQLP